MRTRLQTDFEKYSYTQEFVYKSLRVFFSVVRSGKFIRKVKVWRFMGSFISGSFHQNELKCEKTFGLLTKFLVINRKHRAVFMLRKDAVNVSRPKRVDIRADEKVFTALFAYSVQFCHCGFGYTTQSVGSVFLLIWSFSKAFPYFYIAPDLFFNELSFTSQTKYFVVTSIAVSLLALFE